MLERVGFLQTQLADLNDARESLQDVINEMDKLCRTKLWDVFKQVQVEFGKIFNQLFLGGKAELVLTDPESILTTGIEVMARPPGKKLQNLLVLSGEKGPSPRLPFCLPSAGCSLRRSVS